MSAHLVGVTALGGVPLFSRQVGNRQEQQSIPFATLAALNGVNLFSRLNDANLQATSTKHTKIRWKVFADNIVLILVVGSDGTNIETFPDVGVKNILERIFKALVFCCGLEEISNAQNVERLKRSLKSSYQFIDSILQQLIIREFHLNIITNGVNYNLVDQLTLELFQSILESIEQVAQTDFASIVVNKTLIAATKGWWTRIATTQDAAVTLAYVNHITPELEREAKNIKEIPVFLPENCPNSVTRLIVAKLCPSVHIIVLCDEQPSLDVITNALNSMKEFEMISTNLRRLEMAQTDIKFLLNEHIQSAIAYKHELNLLLMQGNIDSHKLHSMTTMAEIFPQSSNVLSMKPHESYLKFKQHQCYSIAHERNRIILLFSNAMALDAMREISLQSMSIFKDKKIWHKIT